MCRSKHLYRLQRNLPCTRIRSIWDDLQVCEAAQACVSDIVVLYMSDMTDGR